MADNFQDGVSRVLSLLNRQLTQVVWQAGKPPLDSELNLVGQISFENLADNLRSLAHSGFLLDPLRATEDFILYPNGVNYLELGREPSASEETAQPLVALVNGWVIPILGFETSTGKSNAISISTPPSSGSATSFVFLEVWKAVLDADSDVNRPSDSTIYPFGNTGFTAFSYPDEMIDPSLGFSTTKRVQIQFRIRTQTLGVDLVSYPRGLGSSEIYAQGTQSSPIEGYSFEPHTTDAGLFIAGNGDSTSQEDLGTTDGYVYAIPICGVFRRNSGEFQAVSIGGTPNHNGASRRTTLIESGLLTEISLAEDISALNTGVVAVSNLIGSGIDDTTLISDGERFLVLGEGVGREVISISEVDTANDTITILSRGRAGTQAKPHAMGVVISAYNTRPDNYFSDGVYADDILDLRHGVSFGDWDYQRLLEGSVSSLLRNNLRTAFKQAGVGSNSIGVSVKEVSSLSNETYTYTNQVDAPNGIRQIWSDAAVMQSNVEFLVDFGVTLDDSGFATEIDAGLTDTWTTSAKFAPRGFFQTIERIKNGTTIFFSVGGADGLSGARAGIQSTNKQIVRFVAPFEKPSLSPVKVRYMGHNRANLIGSSDSEVYLTPTEISNFEEPYLVLGGAKDTFAGRTASLVSTGSLRNLKAVDPISLSETQIWAVNIGENSETLFNTQVLDDGTTIQDLVTDFGEDIYGTTSQIYLISFGDTTDPNNNGAFRVVGNYLSLYHDVLEYKGLVLQGVAGNKTDGDEWTGETTPSNWLYLTRVGSTSDVFTTTSKTLTFEIRTQKIDSRDESCAIVFTAVKDSDGVDLPAENTRTSGNLLISTTLLYPPGRGATARTLDRIEQVVIHEASNEYLRNNPASLDPSGVASIPLQTGETYLPTRHHISTSSSLQKAGQYVKNSEQQGSLDTECFIDVGSKSLYLKPLRTHGMKLFEHDLGENPLGDSLYADGSTPLLDGSFKTTGSVYEVPFEALPNFGRNDIPFHKKISSTDPYMEGFNQVFLSQRNTSNGVFKFIGGESDGATGGVSPYLFVTGVGSAYGGKQTSALVANQSCITAQKVVLTNPTPEFGDTHNGIKLPPYYGIARLYGVYELAEFNLKAPSAGRGAHQSDRETLITNGPTNLLRKDASLYPIHILKDGGSSATGLLGSHTYVVMEHAIDITKASNYTAGDSFTTFDYVIECEVFVFARGFISHNNFILPRVYGGDGALVGTSDYENIRMAIASAVPATDSVYVTGARTVYQGDPYHTIGGSSHSVADSPSRYGLVSSSDAYKLATPRGQLLEDGTSAIELANPRSVEVVASLDFFTTLGSGSIGGPVIENSLSDVGFVRYARQGVSAELARIPASAVEPLPQTQVNLFTAPLDNQSDYSYATLKLYSYTENVVITYEDSFGSISYETLTDTPASLSELASLIEAYFADNGLLTTSILGDGYLLVLFQSRNRGDNSATLSVLADTQYRTRVLTRLYSGKFTYDVTATTPNKVSFEVGRITPVNGASEEHQVDISLVGMTSRLPLGILVSDFDFMGEDPLRDESGAFQTLGANSTSYPSSLSVNELGEQYTKVSGSAGEILQMGDGALLTYGAYPLSGGTQKYRITRGGGSLFGAFGRASGAPLTFLNKSIPAQLSPVLKGSVLACRAMLVKNFKEESFTGANLTLNSEGSELQLVVVTSAVYQNSSQEGRFSPIVLKGEISPSGFGEGFVASDRYKISGAPLVKEITKKPELQTPAKKV
jgi:hypothetical protein